MTNAELAAAFKNLARVLEYRGENAFKTRSYTRVADTLKKASVEFAAQSRKELLSVDGIGNAIADKILELSDTGRLALYDRLVDDMPAVAVELLGVKGLGVKKVRQLVEELNVASVGELQHAIEENRVVQLKGFSTATQAKLADQLAFHQGAKGKLRLKDALLVSEPILRSLRQLASHVELTGALRRQSNTVSVLEFISSQEDSVLQYLHDGGFRTAETANVSAPRCLTRWIKEDVQPPIHVYLCEVTSFAFCWLATTGSEAFLAAHPSLVNVDAAAEVGDESEVFAKADLPYVPAPQREAGSPYPPTPADEVLQVSDIRGIVHAHTTASDGSATLPELADATLAAGYAYLTVTDHSRAAGYANGLSVERLRDQGAEIAAYNEAHPEFLVFSGTECDILRDGRLDYSDDVLSELDIVIASVHSVLTMSPADATDRLLRAISNPYTTMLGHPTGRLLLSRAGYEPDMVAVLEACAEHEVAVEINASAMRLDLDWSYVGLAVSLGVKLSINPDAHSMAHLDNVRYGVLAAQKAGLRARDCLNCLSAADFSDYLTERKRRRGIS